MALDAAARGFKVVLVESHDFAKGTSSRATKLVHGGVRYLAQGNIALVREALHERTTLLHNAPLAQPLAFVMPSYKLLDTPFYGIGLKMYDALAGKAGLGATEFLSRSSTVKCLPTVRQQGLKGGVKYWDGQFDDARLALALARTAAAKGAAGQLLPARELLHEGGKVAGLICEDSESGQRFTLRAKCVVNATGPWVDLFRQQDAEAQGRPVKPMVAPSQGVHVVVDRDFLPSDHALLVPKTADGRVLLPCPGWARSSWAPPTRRATTWRANPCLSPKNWTSSSPRQAATSRASPRWPTCAACGWACARWSSPRTTMAKTPRRSAASTPSCPAAPAW